MNVEDDVSLPTLSDGEVLVKTTYAGVNFVRFPRLPVTTLMSLHADRHLSGRSCTIHPLEGSLLSASHQRAGVYKIATPATLGNEVAGMVEKLGPGVTPESAGFAVGDRVAVCRLPCALWAAPHASHRPTSH